MIMTQEELAPLQVYSAVGHTKGICDESGALAQMSVETLLTHWQHHVLGRDVDLEVIIFLTRQRDGLRFIILFYGRDVANVVEHDLLFETCEESLTRWE